MTKGTLFLIPNTLGDDPRDVQLPFVLPNEVAKQASQLEFWIVENAKTARSFLKAVNTLYPLIKPLQEIKMVEWSGPQTKIDIKDLLKPLLLGNDLGLLSEAGLPAVADPGTEIVAAAHLAKIKVRPLTGPSSLMLALMASGMNGQGFMFHGYIAIKPVERMQALKTIEAQSKKNHATQLWIETPYRNLGMLETCIETLQPHTQLCIAAHVTLADELIVSQSIGEWRKAWKSNAPEIQFLEKKPAVFLLQA
jgi:16S rRNA (cytidine1402-2'-O)-methyltransferase